MLCFLVRLIDGDNITMSDEHMWLIPFTEGASHQLTITFNHVTRLMALRIWNYNKSPEDTFRGVRLFAMVFLSNKELHLVIVIVSAHYPLPAK